MEVVKRQSVTVLGQHALDFGQVEDTLDQLVKLAFTHTFYGWRNVLHDGAFNNESMRAFLALTILEILNLLFYALVAVFGLA